MDLKYQSCPECEHNYLECQCLDVEQRRKARLDKESRDLLKEFQPLFFDNKEQGDE